MMETKFQAIIVGLLSTVLTGLVSVVGWLCLSVMDLRAVDATMTSAVKANAEAISSTSSKVEDMYPVVINMNAKLDTMYCMMQFKATETKERLACAEELLVKARRYTNTSDAHVLEQAINKARVN